MGGSQRTWHLFVSPNKKALVSKRLKLHGPGFIETTPNLSGFNCTRSRQCTMCPKKKHKLGFSWLITKITLPKLVPILIRRCWVRIWARIWKRKCSYNFLFFLFVLVFEFSSQIYFKDRSHFICVPFLQFLTYIDETGRKLKPDKFGVVAMKPGSCGISRL